MVEQPATRADLYRVAAFLRELDRMMHPVTTRSGGGYRLPPVILPPLPPTGSGGDGPSARRGPGWMTTRAAPPRAALSPTEVDWVESPVPFEVRTAPAPASVAPLGSAPQVLPDAVRPGPTVGVVAPVDQPAAPARAPVPSAPPKPATPVGRPAPDLGQVRQRSGVATNPDTTALSSPAVAEAPSEAAVPPRLTQLAAAPGEVPGSSARPALPMVPADRREVTESRTVPEPPPRRRQEWSAAKPDGDPAAAGRPPAAIPGPPDGPRTSSVRPEPVDLIVDGLDAVSPPEEPADAASAPLDDYPLDDYPLDDAASVPGPPPLPGVRGPRRSRALLPAATADRVQAELQRRYLDRTLGRSR